MSITAYIGIPSLPTGITLPAGATAQRTSARQTVGIYKPVGATGEIVKLLPHGSVKVENSCDYLGLPARTQIVAAIATLGTPAPTQADHTEKVNEGGSGRVQVTDYLAYTAGAGGNPGAGAAAADLGVINMRSVIVSAGQQARSSTKVKDVFFQGFDGAPGFHGTCTVEHTFNVQYKGNVPTSVSIGTAGAGYFGISGSGITVCSDLTAEQTMDDANGGNYAATNGPTATA